jgi:hypothetical protein
MKTRKRAAAFLALLLTIVLFSSMLFLGAEAHHECSGEDCPICLEMQSCENLLRSIVILAGSILLTALLCRFASALHTAENTELAPITLVSLKVKLSN